MRLEITPRGNGRLHLGVQALEREAKAKIVLLKEEIEAIDYANRLFWKTGASQSTAARSEYQFRNERLQKIRAELAQLRFTGDLSNHL